jgi:acetyl esterase/lipase
VSTTGSHRSIRIPPLDDCHAGLKWLYENADELGVDRSRIGVAGASAAGGLAAALALLARDRGEIPLTFQLLIYPMIDDRQTTMSSGWEVPVWTPAANTIGWRSYLGDRYGETSPPTRRRRARPICGGSRERT